MSENQANPWERYWERFSTSARANPAQAFRRRLIHILLGAEAAGPDATILDIGCGSGDLLAELGESYPRAAIAGVDISHSGLAEARAKTIKAEGRYPIAVKDRVMDLDLPAGLDRDDAIAWNRAFEEQSGIVVEDDGQVVYCGTMRSEFAKLSPALAEGFHVDDLETVYEEMVELRGKLGG